MLVILDPSLRSYNGHFLTYDKVIADEVERRGEQCVVLAARDVASGVAGSLRVVPCFRFGLEAPEDERILARAFLSDLLRAMQSIALKPGTNLFLHTTTHRQIEPAVLAMEKGDLRKATLTILLRYSVAPNPAYPNAESVWQYQQALACIPRLGLEDRVRLVTDSELLADEYRSITSLPIDVIPIPHAGCQPQSHNGHSIPHLVYLGNARATKGFHYLPHMVSQIRPQLLAGSWIAEFQANVMFRRDAESVAAVCALRDEPVTLWEDELSLEQYDALLDRAALVVLPYQTLYYHSQTSGVFAEAIGRGKPVVVPKGTWMARQIAGTDAGILFAPGDRADLATAVKSAISDIDRLTAGAKSLQPSWVAAHNPAAFVGCLFERNASL